MKEFWELSFKEMKTTWGFHASDSALLAKDLFLQNKAKEILIPGIGYGRNAKIFCDAGMTVTGIWKYRRPQLSWQKRKMSWDIKIHHGSVVEMPYDNKLYDGIFCYAMVHLLNSRERKKFIADCYKQLKPDGYMVFLVVSKQASMYGSGKQLSTDRFEITKGLNVFFYDIESVKNEFNSYGFIECFEMDEPIKHMENEPPLKCILVKCRKGSRQK